MVPMELLATLAQPTPSKIVLAVCDGFGGLPHPETGRSELETACTPNLDALANRSQCGVIEMVGPGITPGSGPGHLALFGYDPIRYDVGRGALSALGIDFPLQPGDVAARMNFATVDADGNIVDRRAGRIPTELTARLCARLRDIRLDGVEVFVEPEQDYRAVLVLRGPDLSDRLSDTDPQRTGVPPLPVRALEPAAERTATLVNTWIARARELLRDERPANAVLLRGFAKPPHIPKMTELYKLRAAAIAVYPMYKGLARLAGMDVLDGGHSLADEIERLRAVWDQYDFFFLHVKWTDSAGEDGDFARKVAVIEQIDRELIPAVLALAPDVFALTGDHSTPSVLAAHSWHPVPFLLHSRWCFPDHVDKWGERAARQGSLGRFPAQEVMGLLLAHALKLAKYGA
ncbi:MAG TPA: 2,3-bisphosphoglycerate-independent phosphoglycerate mutase [Chloroflexota bacterium]|nr:2,3-bisphosphoglycerate-independent phosphoglycerate mutase [Chloroflexota bacterium]